jgi:ABC-type multidrug transport system ATPase subunit
VRIAAALILPEAGTIRVAGFDAGSLEARASIGATVSHEKAFYQRLSGVQNLLFYASIRCRTDREARARVSSLVEELEIDGFVRERADRYSSGMMQQLGVARALIAEPVLLLLDEPTRSLDDNAVGRVWAALDRRPDVAVVVASHRRSDLDRCSQRLELG